MLLDQIRLRVPVADASGRVSALPWDSDRRLATVHLVDAIRVRGAYVSGSLTESEVEEWAETLDCREDVGYEEGAWDLLRELVFVLSSPEINGRLTLAMVEEWKRRLESEARSE